MLSASSPTSVSSPLPSVPSSSQPYFSSSHSNNSTAQPPLASTSSAKLLSTDASSDWVAAEDYTSTPSPLQVGWPPSGEYFSNGAASPVREAANDTREVDDEQPDDGAELPPIPLSPTLSLGLGGGGPLSSSSPSYESENVNPGTTPVVSSLGEERYDGRENALGLGSIPERSAASATALGRASAPAAATRTSTMGSMASAPPQSRMDEDENLVPVGFDEGILKGLCDLDCGMPLLLERMKQAMVSAKEASSFLKKRALIEEEYARSMIKLARSSTESYSLSDGKSGSFVASWQSFIRTHELLGDNRLKFASQLNDMSDELVFLAKEADKTRKANKELGNRLERGLAEQEALVDKARVRFDSAAEELERLLLLKQGESLKDPTNMSHSFTSGGQTTQKRTFGKAMSKLKGPKSVAQVAKQEEEVRSRMGQSSDSYRSQVLGAQAVRQEFFNLQLPKILRALKEGVDEVDLATQYHLSRYSYLFESTLVNDGLTISPLGIEDGPGLKAAIDGIDIREDFKVYMQQFAVSWQMSGQRGPRRDGPPEDGFASSRPSMSPRQSINNMHSVFLPPVSRPTFGVDLGDQMLRDEVEVPRALQKCCEAIELHGLDSMGIYRLSGTTSRVQRLKAKLDRDIEGTDLLSEENLTDINDIAAVMKLWFRELPEPLLTWELYQGFIEAAKIENDRLRHIRLHERVNDLPDPNYATLKYLMGHLDKVKSRESVNQMGCSNLAIVFGPNLLGAPPNNGGQGSALADMSWQCKCVETILQHYVEIFVDTEG